VLRAQLGDGYRFERLSAEELIVRTSATIRARVRLRHRDGGTELRITGGGIGIVFRVLNTLGIARRVAAAAEALAGSPDPPRAPPTERRE
jgi:hypothetical protein